VLTRVAAAVREIEGAESLADLRSVRPLVGSPAFYRIRIGEYRLGMLVEGEAVEVVRFLHRREIYRYFP
jgi:mRNA interferase RelE/StbE